jgi:poly-gamma-glutamate synthesis protein (capsule biosynthesis protein)
MQAILVLCAAILLPGCERSVDASTGLVPPPALAATLEAPPPPPDAQPPAPDAQPPAPDAQPPAPDAQPPAPNAAAAPRDSLTLIAGGDVCLGKALGQELLRDPAYDPFAPAAALLASADVRFVNLEGQLSDQRGETQHPGNPLVFTGPPAGADALARAGITVVSVANNHMWDYGEGAFLETLRHLERAGVAYAGGGRTRRRAYTPVLIERDGFRVAVLAVTDIWNQGTLWEHPARERVAAADVEGLAATVRAARVKLHADAVVVSQHGGVEYLDWPPPHTRAFARASIDAGADAFLGHHPHVIQGVEVWRGRPIFYSLGNFVMTMSGEHPEAAIGMLARLRLRRGAPPEVEVCPVRSEGLGVVPLAADPQRVATEAAFTERLKRVSTSARRAAPALGPFAADGCAPLQ